MPQVLPVGKWTKLTVVVLKGIKLLMVKENISLTQLFVLIFNFLLGSAIVIGIRKRCHAKCLDFDFFDDFHWDWVDVFVLQHQRVFAKQKSF